MGDPSSALTPELEPAAPDPRRWLVLALLGTAFFIVILDSTIVFVAVPSIQAQFGFAKPASNGCSAPTS